MKAECQKKDSFFLFYEVAPQGEERLEIAFAAPLHFILEKSLRKAAAVD
jgi:hypothetical protein